MLFFSPHEELLDMLYYVGFHVLLGVTNVLLPGDIAPCAIDNYLLTASTTTETLISLAAVAGEILEVKECVTFLV